MEKSLVRRLNIQGMLLQASFWIAVCMYGIFMVTTLIDYGWSASAAAFAMTMMGIISMLVQPVLGYVSDKFLSEKKMIVILSSLAIAFCILLPFSLRSGNPLLVWLTMIAITVTGMQIAGLVDAWLVGLSQEFEGVNYGLMRGTGSFAFAIASQVAGIITYTFGHHTRIYFGAGFFFLTVIVALTFRSAKSADQTDEHSEATTTLTGREALRIIFSSKQFRMILAVAFFLLLAHAPLGILLQLLVIDFGGTTAQIGTASAVMAASEVPVMFLMVLILKKFGYKKLIVFASGVYVIRMVIMAAIGSVTLLIASQGLQAFTFAILTPLAMSYLSQILDKRIRTTAITTYAAITMGLSGIIGNLITTTLLEMSFTAQNILVVSAVASLIGFIFAIYGAVRKIWDIEVV